MKNHLRARALLAMRLPLTILTTLVTLALVQVMRGADGEAVSAARASSEEAARRPERIIPCSAATSDWLAKLVPSSRVAALPEQVAKWSMIEGADGWGEIPRFARVESESLLGQRPDLVLASPFTDSGVLARVKDATVRVVVVVEPTDWRGMLDSGRLIAEATGTAERWDELSASLQQRRDALAARHPDTRPRVLPFGNYGTENFTSGSNSTLHLALELAGCTNHAATLGIEGPSAVSVEQILAEPFDWFLVSGDGPNNPSTRALRTNERLASVQAVENVRFIVLPPALYSSGSHTIVNAAEAIAEAVGH